MSELYIIDVVLVDKDGERVDSLKEAYGYGIFFNDGSIAEGLIITDKGRKYLAEYLEMHDWAKDGEIIDFDKSFSDVFGFEPEDGAILKAGWHGLSIIRVRPGVVG